MTSQERIQMLEREIAALRHASKVLGDNPTPENRECVIDLSSLLFRLGKQLKAFQMVK